MEGGNRDMWCRFATWFWSALLWTACPQASHTMQRCSGSMPIWSVLKSSSGWMSRRPEGRWAVGCVGRYSSSWIGSRGRVVRAGVLGTVVAGDVDADVLVAVRRGVLRDLEGLVWDTLANPLSWMMCLWRAKLRGFSWVYVHLGQWKTPSSRERVRSVVILTSD
ncbi:uncharacterized protein EI90DRAFT_3103594 [Cantharellus anzutake]|uniref:uncharacterized protein n=1 Tax=Cantharellus anzutake TaxID=1750568 RepID=UPI00190896E9|nr:uncharacterized protein EI90DRAFT_3103594 [Cantharellus anzutake]KAF8309774.1 hypothetical protein EI90DRAFT_3103594 [Cantharellus anzutake]